MKKKTVNIHVDASFSHEHSVASYAFWISFGARNASMKNVGGLPAAAASATLAELYAIRNAVQVIARHPSIHEVEIVKIHNDCFGALEAIAGKATKNDKINEVAAHIAAIIEQIKAKASVSVVLCKIDGHIEPNNKGQHVHDWCDKSSREKLQLLIKQKTKRNYEK